MLCAAGSPRHLTVASGLTLQEASTPPRACSTRDRCAANAFVAPRLLDGEKLLSGAGSALALTQAQSNTGLSRTQGNAELTNRLRRQLSTRGYIDIEVTPTFGYRLERGFYEDGRRHNIYEQPNRFTGPAALINGS